MLFIDAHVHMHPCYRFENLVTSAFSNFLTAERAAGEDGAMLLMFVAELSGSSHFTSLQEEAHGEISAEQKWQVTPTAEPGSLILAHSDFEDRTIILISGEQIITRENIEVLAIGCSPSPAAGMKLSETVHSALSSGGIAILPWGVGKWLGERGRIIDNFLAHERLPLLFLGDNGSRPPFWPVPRFKPSSRESYRRLLSGTDPLPLRGEEQRVGNFGSFLPGTLDQSTPFASLKSILGAEETKISGYGHLQRPLSFIKQQVALRRTR